MLHEVLLPVLAQETLSPLAIVQNEVFHDICDVFSFISDGHDVILLAVSPAVQAVHKHVVKPLVEKVKAHLKGGAK